MASVVPVASDARAEGEDLLNLLLHESVDLIFITDGSGRFKHVSQVLTGIWGNAPRDWFGRTIDEMGLPASIKHPIEAAIKDVLTHGRPATTSFLTSDKARLSLTLFPLAATDGSVHHVVATTRDLAEVIGDAKELGAERLELFKELEMTVDQRSVLTAVRNATGSIIDFEFSEANEAALAYNQKTSDELIGMRLLDLYPGLMEAGIFDRYVNTVESGVPISMDDLPYADEVHNGEVRHFSIRAARFGDGLVLIWRDTTKQWRETGRLIESESRYRLIAESASDVVFELGIDQLISWVSPSVQEVLGWTPEQLIGVAPIDLAHPDDLVRVNQQRAAMLEFGRARPIEIRFQLSNKDYRWVSVSPRVLVEESGDVRGFALSLRDCHREVSARRALLTLSAGNEVLLTATSRDQLLADMCQIAVDEGGYAFAWYGKKVDDAGRSVEPEASSLEDADYLVGIKITWGKDEFGRGPTGRSIRGDETIVENSFDDDQDYDPWRQRVLEHGFRSSISLPVHVDDAVDGAFVVDAVESNTFDRAAVSMLEDLASQIGVGLALLIDHDRLVASLNEQKLLSQAIEKSGEGILVTDLSGAILYANPAILETSGYSSEEILGQNPRIFNSDFHPTSFFTHLWETITHGEVWRGTMTNRRKNGEIFEVSTTISPIQSLDGEPTSYTAVMRDLTLERRLQSDLLQEKKNRVDLIEMMEHVQPLGTFEETAAQFCDATTKLGLIDAAVVLIIRDDGKLHQVSADNGTRFLGRPDGLVNMDDPQRLINRTNEGPWWIDLTTEQFETSSSLANEARAAGYTALAMLPIRWQGRIDGLLALGTLDRSGPLLMEARLPALVEVSSFAGTLFGSQAEIFGHQESIQAEIRDVVEHQRFHPVFQPVVNVNTGAIVGYEGLTRFDDGRQPDLRFVEASSVGLGMELEVACARAAIEAADAEGGLAGDAWLSVNFSPKVVISGEAATLAKTTARKLAIEVTEHAHIDDYEKLRAAIGEITGCNLFVDDAGAGYAGLRHILELHPDLIKLDIALVRGVDSDPARQALVSGMRHFANQTGTLLLAEGVETPEEAKTLASLGVDFAQGFLYGRPEPITD